MNPLKTLSKMIRTTFSWLEPAITWLSNSIQDVWIFMWGILAAIIGYFVPIKDMVHLVLILFFVDVLIGFWAAKKLRKEPFNPAIIWGKTIPRAAISIIIIMCTMAWDTTFGQNFVSTSGFIAWFISGIIIVSILKNGRKVTNWTPFGTIEDVIKKNVEKKLKRKQEDYEESN